MGVGAVALGAAYYFFGTEGSARDTAKELGSKGRGMAAAVEGKMGLRRGQDEYQKVYDKIAEELEVENHDGELSWKHAFISDDGSIQLNTPLFQMGLLHLF